MASEFPRKIFRGILRKVLRNFTGPRVLSPKTLIWVFFVVVSIAFFQNCQQNPDKSSLSSLCSGTSCGGGTIYPPNPDYLLVSTRISQGILQTTATTFTVDGDCNNGGYPNAIIYGTLSRSGGPIKNVTVACSAGSWTQTLNGIQDFNPQTNPSLLSFVARIEGRDSNNQPIVATSGMVSIPVYFEGAVPTPTTTTTPPPGAVVSTLSLVDMRPDSSAKQINIRGFFYPTSLNQVDAKVIFRNLTKGGPYRNIPYNGISVIQGQIPNILPFINVVQDPDTTDPRGDTYEVAITVTVGGTTLRDPSSGYYIFQKSPVTGNYNDIQFTAPPYKSDNQIPGSVAADIRYLYYPGVTNPMTRWDYRVIGTNPTDWVRVDENITISGPTYDGRLYLTPTRLASPQTKAILFHLFSNGTFTYHYYFP